MVILRKLDTAHLSVEAYEQYGDHPAPSLGTVYKWASRTSSRYAKKENAK